MDDEKEVKTEEAEDGQQTENADDVQDNVDDLKLQLDTALKVIDDLKKQSEKLKSEMDDVKKTNYEMLIRYGGKHTEEIKIEDAIKALL